MVSSVQNACAAYLDAWQRKDLQGIVACLHPEVQFKSPNESTRGRDMYVPGAQRFLSLVDRVEVRAKFLSQDGAMFVLDFHCLQPIGVCPTAELVGFKDGLIYQDEIFFDARPFEALMRAKVAGSVEK